VVQGELPDAVRQRMEMYVGCIAGALEDNTYRRLLGEAGFHDVGVEVTRVYDEGDLAASECCSNPTTQAGLAELTARNGRIVSAFIRATKPSR
jgi:arsenite methyltransferase